ncbi:MAG TPA: polysaccharide deacetylase family protein [Azoarcus taiwanensis]|nr:polysaccharide deacetylase family protein [Azoarcus taiwanensis]
MFHPLTAALALASPAGTRGRLTILIYHRVLAAPDALLPDTPDRAAFDWQMALVKRHFQALPLAEAGRLLQQGRLPARAACITFDDGYADNLTEAWPILNRHGLPATFFVATGFLDGGRMFNDTLIELVRRMPEGDCDLTDVGVGVVALNGAESRIGLIHKLIGQFKYQQMTQRQESVEALASRFGVTLPDDLMMTTDELRKLADSAGVEIGGHTRNHPILTRLEDDAAREEILAGKHDLEARLERPVRLFAYPNGRPGKDYDARHAAMARECGFELAVSTAPAAARVGADPFQLPRFTPWDRTPGRFGLRLLRTLMT